MKSRYLTYSILLLAVLVLPACRKTETFTPEQSPVNLSLSFDAPKAAIYSGGTTKTEDTDLREAVGGNRIFSLFVMLIKLDDTDNTTPDWDKDGTLVAYRELYQKNGYDEDEFLDTEDNPDFSTDTAGEGDNGLCDESGSVTVDYKSPYATVNFNYFKPLHGDVSTSCEKLVPGKYKMLAVANYRGRKDDVSLSRPVPGIDNGQMKALVQSIKKDFIANVNNGGVRNFLEKKYSAAWIDQVTMKPTTAEGLKIRDYVLDVTDAGHVCPLTTQLLTFDRVLTLAASDNVIEEELEKTYTRLRIVIENDHPDSPLTVHSLELGTMTQQSSPLFVRDDGKGGQYSDDRVAPVMNAENAITKFTGGLVVPADGEETAFDAYLLESRFDPSKLSAADAGFWFRTVVEYEGKTYNAKYTVINRDAYDNPVPVKTASELNYWIKGSGGVSQATSNFLIRSQTGSILTGNNTVEDVLGSFLYADGSQVLTTPTRSDIIEDPMVWTIEEWEYYREGRWSPYYYRGYIHNVNGYLVSPKTSSESPLVTSARRSYVRFDDADYGGNGMAADGSYDNRALHLTDQGSGVVLAIGPDETSYDRYPYYGWPDTGTTASNAKVHWSLYPLGGGNNIPARRDSYKVPLKRLNEDNTQVDITEIKRGDYLTIRIIVNLNEQKSDFEFVVEPWAQGGKHGIEFD